ncbi:MAG: rhomboid family intramembrane serine protease [bacterium]
MTLNHDARTCARCGYPMVATNFDGKRVDHCHRCGGSLIESGGAASQAGEWADPSYWRETLGRPTQGNKLPCPACNGPMDGFQVPWGGRSVVVDHCNTCGSLFLDAGEGQKLASIVQEAEAQGGLKGAKDSMGRKVKNLRPAYDYDGELLGAQDDMQKPGLRVYIFQLLTGMPVEVWNPVRQTPWATRTTTVILIALFVVQIMAMLGMGIERGTVFLRFFSLVPSEIAQGRHLWGLVTYMFLHAGWFHLLGNLYFLNVFGDNVEDRLGLGRVIGLYLLSGIMGGVLQTVLSGNPDLPVVGASGAIAGLMGAYLVLFPRVKVWMVLFFMHWRVPIALYLGGWVLLNIAGWYLGGHAVAWWAHLGGFLTGALLALLLRD